MIYLDHNATTPVDERVVEAMMPFLTTFYGNPSALYRAGRIVRSSIEGAREQVASLVGVRSGQVVFTSGGTESNNLALGAVAVQSGLAISAIEHPSISEPAQRLARQGVKVRCLPVDEEGLLIKELIEQAAEAPMGFASLMLANNETGAIQSIAEHADVLRAKNIIVHTDAVQAVGKIPVSFSSLNVHLMSLSSHKIYGPKGCGALIVEKEIEINPILEGGGQEQGLRAGTENVAAIIGFGKAAELAKAELNTRYDDMMRLRTKLEQGLQGIPGIVVFAKNSERLPNTVQFGIGGFDGEMLQMQLDAKGVAVSSGSACASGGGKPSPVLAAMGIEQALAKSAIRISLGRTNTEAEVAQVLDILKTLLGRN